MGQLERSLCTVAVCLHSPQIPALCTRLQAGLFRFFSFIALISLRNCVKGLETKKHIGNIWSCTRADCSWISVYNHHIRVMYIHTEEERGGGRQSDNFLSPSPARGILYFYWTFGNGQSVVI